MGQLRGLISLVFSVFVILQLLSNVVDAQTKCQNFASLSGNMPYILNITDLSYTMTVEANLQEKKKTLYVTEYYDKEWGNGRLDVLNGGKVTKFLYLNETAEIFTVKDNECTTQDMNKGFETPFDQFNLYKWNDPNTMQPIIGPSNLLRYGVENKARQETQTGQTVRGIKTNVYRLCDNDGKLAIRYFFIDPTTENGFGIVGKDVPARITVEGQTAEGGNIMHTYDIVNYQTFVPDIGNTFKIPKMVGCTRLAGAGDEKKVPNYDNKDFHLEAEVVYTPWGNSNFSYVNTLSVTMDAKSKHFAFETNTWKSHKDAEIAEPGDELKVIYDIQNEYRYEIDESYEACSVLNVDEGEVGNDGYKPQLKLPDGQVLDLLSADLFVRDKITANQYHYLGDDTERGIPVSVFEKHLKEESEDDFDDIIITRYHLADDTILNTEFSEKNAPIKIVYSNFNIAQKFVGIVVFNIYAFTSTVTKKAEYFDVTTCFKDDDQSRWFQLIFPMRDNKPDDVIPFIPFIEDNFLNLLQVPLVGSPLRVPKVMVDVDMDNIYVTALLLERPDFMLDFQTQGKSRITKEPNDMIGLTTQEGCAKACLEKPSCVFFSYCGALCTLATDDPGTDGIQDDNRCEMFMHDKYDTALLTMDEITTNIAGSVEMGSIVFMLPKPNGKVMEFLATGFKEEVAFGLNGEKRNDEDINDRLKTGIFGRRLDETKKDVVKPLGTQSFATCRRACLNNPECESLSFCQATSDCSLSTLHGEEIKDEFMKEDWQCEIMSKAYSDKFEAYPGLVLAQTAKKVVELGTSDACAKACVQETGFNCQSFDFCAGGSGKATCLLHTTHFLSLGSDESKVNTDNAECGHYSKKLVYDFKSELGKGIVETEVSVQIDDVNPEQCAKYCLENARLNCQTFESCTTLPITLQGSTCRLFSKTKGGLQKKDAPLCKIYERSVRAAAPSASANQGYKKSTVGGVGFFLFLVGLAIGVAGMFAYGYYRANRR